MILNGIDLSRWQTVTPSLTGLSFLFAKASEGTSADPKYAMHIANAGPRLVTGAYLFARDDVSIPAQAAFFVAAAVGADLLVVDNEGAHALTQPQARALITAIRAADTLHRKVGLYMSASVFFDAGQDFDWIADYRTGVTHSQPGTFWQYTSSGSIPGYNGRLDLDRFNGTLAQLNALAGKPPPAPRPAVVLAFGAKRTVPFPDHVTGRKGASLLLRRIRPGPGTQYAPVATLTAGRKALVYQVTSAPHGSVLDGSSIWYGDITGTRWVHAHGLTGKGGTT